MGLETVAAQLIIIGAFLYFAVIIVDSFNNNWTGVHDSLKKYNEKERSRVDESIEIFEVTYDAINSVTEVKINNTGKTMISLDFIDVFQNSIRIPRLNDNRTLNVQSNSELKNPGLWDPEEILEINISGSLPTGSHFVEVFTKNGINDIKSFSVI